MIYKVLNYFNIYFKMLAYAMFYYFNCFIM